MDLVLMGVKKAFDKRAKDSKERRKEKKRKEKIGQVGEQSRYRTYRTQKQNIYKHTTNPKKEIKETLTDKRR
ncbi:hypothetical protein AGMMS49921_02390 [Endomicrobiia bacterium]|nr:hypothetical protein AGMMS49921_02390 [Endomicrobiia bacterium]